MSGFDIVGCFNSIGVRVNRAYNDNFIKHAVNQYSGMIYRIAFQYVKNKSDAEDITQDVFLSLIKQENFFEEEHLKAWLIRVTINKCKNFLKSSRIRKVVPLEKAENTFAQNEIQFLDEINNLSEDDRNILYLFYYEGYSAKEVAKILYKKEDAVFKNLSRARERLKHFMEVSK